MSVFYSYSNNRDEIKNTYNLVHDKLNDLIIDIDCTNNSIEKISNYILTSKIFVCDVTPDHILDLNIDDNNFEEKIISLVNSNVMLELGISNEKLKKNNIIILCNEKITKKVPSLLQGYDILYYNSDNGYNYYLDIVEKITNKLKKIKEYENYIQLKFMQN